MVKIRMLVALCSAVVLIACGKTEPAKTTEQQKSEQEKAAKTTRENPVYGEQVKAIDKAKKDTEKATLTAEEKLLKEGY